MRYVSGSQTKIYDPFAKLIARSKIPLHPMKKKHTWSHDRTGSYDTNVGWIWDPKGSRDKKHDRIYDRTGPSHMNEVADMCAGLWSICST